MRLQRGKDKSRRRSQHEAVEVRHSWIFTICFSVFLGGAFYVAGAYLYFSVLPKFWSVQQVEVKGYLAANDVQALQTILSDKLRGNLFALSLSSAGNAIRSLPWVASVQLTRRFPHSVEVVVTARQPVAVFNDSWFVDANGNLFANYHVAKGSAPLPRLYGPNDEAVSILGHYKLFAQILGEDDLKVAAVKLNNSLSWQLQTVAGMQVIVGQKNEIDRVVRFANTYDNLRNTNKKQEISRVDLRYPYGLAVKWQ